MSSKFISIYQRFSAGLEGPFKAVNLETFILPLLGRNQGSLFLQNKLCCVDSRGVKRKDSWELLALPVLFCARLQMKMCRKRCKSWVPQGRELWYTRVLYQSTGQQHANDSVYSSSISYHLGTHFPVLSHSWSNNWCQVLLFYSIIFFYYYCNYYLLHNAPRKPCMKLSAVLVNQISVFLISPAESTHLCFMYLIYSKCTKWQFIISLSTVKDIITSRNEKKVQPYVEMLYFVHF